MKIIFLFFIISFHFIFSKVVYFIPPKDWKYVDPNKLNKFVKIGFIKKDKFTNYSPSINFAKEKTSLSQESYLKEVKKQYLSDKNISMSIIGNVKNEISNINPLILIQKNTNVGRVILLQSITIKDESAYILTASCLKKEFITYKDIFLNSFKSLKKSKDLFSEIKTDREKTNLQKMIDELKNKKLSNKNFVKYIEENFHYLGNHWKYLLIKNFPK